MSTNRPKNDKPLILSHLDSVILDKLLMAYFPSKSDVFYTGLGRIDKQLFSLDRPYLSELYISTGVE